MGSSLDRYSLIQPRDSLNSYSIIEPPEEGMLSYLGNFARNFDQYIVQDIATRPNDPIARFVGDKLLKARRALGNSSPEIEEEVMRKIQEARGLEAESKRIAMHDLSNIFGKIGNAFSDDDLTFMDKVKAGVAGLPGMIAELPRTITTPFEAGLGIAVTEKGAPVLQPEERAEKLKETAGVVLSSALGLASRAAVGAFMGSQAGKAVRAVEAGLTPPKLIGKTGRKLITGFTEGAVAGVSYGAIGRANEEDQLTTMLMGIAFAPLGAAFELVTKSKLDTRMTEADRLFITRQMQYKPEDVSLHQQAKLFEDIATSDDIVKAVAEGNLPVKGRMVLQGLTHDQTVKVKTASTGYGIIAFSRDIDFQSPEVMKAIQEGGDVWEKSKYDVLLFDNTSNLKSKDLRSFQEFGFIPDEIVSYQGRDFIFNNSTYKFNNKADKNVYSATLTDPAHGRTVNAPLNELRRQTTLNVDRPELIFSTERSLKGLWLEADKVGNPKVYDDANQKALDNAKTGEPLIMIGYRQDRGKEIGLSKKEAPFRFYAAETSHVVQYVGSKYKGFSAEDIKTGKTSYSYFKNQENKLGETIMRPGRPSSAGPIESLIIHRLPFEKPYVFDGKHKQLVETLRDSYNYVPSKINTYDAHMSVIFKSASYDDYVKIVKSKSAIEPYSELEWKYYRATDMFKKDKDHISNLFTNQEAKAIDQASDLIYGNKAFAGKTHPESGYQLIDTIIAKAMKRNGYDAFIFRSDLGNTEIMSLRTSHIGQRSLHKGELKARTQQVIDIEAGIDRDLATRIVDNMYEDFKPLILDNDDNIMPFDKLFESYVKGKGFLDTELPALKISFEKRLANDLQKLIPDNERAILSKVQGEIDQIKLSEFDKLRVNVHSNGMYFDTGSNGVIKIRDRETSILLYESQSIEEANAFVNRSGQMNTVDLDGNSPIPPKLINGNIPPGGGNTPFHEGMIPDQPTRMERFVSHIPAWYSRNRENFRNIDIKHNLGGVMSRLQDSIDSARRIKLAQENPYMERFQKIHDMLEGSADMDKKIPIWMEMRTSKERIAAGARGGRAMNNDEINLAHTLAGPDGKTDLDKVYKLIEFRRKLYAENKKLPKKDKLTKEQRAEKYEEFKKTLGFTSNEELALSALLFARRLPLDKLETGAAVRLAETLQAEMNGMITDRNVYASKNFNSKQLSAAKQAEQLYRDLASRFGIDEGTLLQGYFPHARTKFDGNLSRTLREFRVPTKEKQFFARMIRTGEIRPHDDGLASATQRYISAGFNDVYLRDTINRAIKEFDETVLPKIQETHQKDRAKAIFHSYVDAVKGRPHYIDKVANDAFRDMLSTIGINLAEDSNLLQNVVNGVMMTVTSATQGIRVALGIRDLYTGLRSYGVKLLSVSKAAEAFRYGFGLENSAVREVLLDTGEVAHYGILQFTGVETESAIRNISSKAGKVLSDVETKMIKAGGQPTVYERLSAGFTIERKKAVMEGARKYLAKQQTKEALAEVYEDLRLDSYDHSVTQNFDKLFQQGSYDEAAKYLARQTVAETLGWYGQGNHPKGWNTYLGRVAGQFGNWSINYRDSILRASAAGKMKDRVTRLAVMAAFDGGLTLAAAKIGISFANWMTLPAMIFSGGPSIDFVQNVNNAMFGYGAEKDIARENLKRFAPLDDDEIRLNQLYIPGGYFANDLAKAAEVADEMGMEWGALRGMGFRVEDSYYKPGFVEEYLKEEVVEPINY